MADKHKYIKYKEKYLMLKKKMLQYGGNVASEYISKNTKISEYLNSLSMCQPNFGVTDLKNLSGRDPSASGAYIATGKLSIDDKLHNVVIKFFVNACPYKYKKKPKKRVDNTTHSFTSRNEVGTMLLLRDKVLLEKCTPNIVWCYKGGVCKYAHKSMTNCRNEVNEDGLYLFQENNVTQFVSDTIIKLLENDKDENAVYEAITKDSHIPYMVVEKCDSSYAGFIESMKDDNTINLIEINKIFESTVIQILITLKILRDMFQSTEFIKLPAKQVHDGCYVEIDNKKIEIIRIINHLDSEYDDYWEMILSDDKIIKHNSNLIYYYKPTFTHNDCHIGNILSYSPDTCGTLLYEIKCGNLYKKFYVPHYEMIAKLWDFDTCDIVHWSKMEKYYDYYKDVTSEKIGLRFNILDGPYMNDVYTFFNTFMNGNGGSYIGISDTKTLSKCDISVFFNECLSLGVRTDFIKLLIDKDQQYIDTIASTSKQPKSIIKLSKYFDEYLKKPNEVKNELKYEYDRTKHSIN